MLISPSTMSMAAAAVATKLLPHHPAPFLSGKLPPFYYSNLGSVSFLSEISTKTRSATSVEVNSSSSGRNGRKNKKRGKEKSFSEALVKRRTRSEKEFDEEAVIRYGGGSGRDTHIPVMLGEVLEVFSSLQLRSFVDCTLGAAGHSSSIIQAHSEMQLYIGLDIDPIPQELAKARIHAMICGDSCDSPSDLKVYTFLRSYRDLRNVLHEVDENLERHGVDGILMDLGMSSMQVNNSERGFSILCDGPLDMRMNPQANLKAEDILNSWPDIEVGRILREYGEERNWYSLQNNIVKARQQGGLHSTSELVRLIQKSTFPTQGGRQGWIKTATRVFQALRIAVNDELNTLRDSLYASFDCLAPGGRLAVISFHSLEDRIVKRTFLDVICGSESAEDEVRSSLRDMRKPSGGKDEDGCEELWINRVINGSYGTILTKRPITPSHDEEVLNRRSRSAKLRVIQKV